MNADSIGGKRRRESLSDGGEVHDPWTRAAVRVRVGDVGYSYRPRMGAVSRGLPIPERPGCALRVRTSRAGGGRGRLGGHTRFRKNRADEGFRERSKCGDMPVCEVGRGEGGKRGGRYVRALGAFVVPSFRPRNKVQRGMGVKHEQPPNHNCIRRREGMREQNDNESREEDESNERGEEDEGGEEKRTRAERRTREENDNQSREEKRSRSRAERMTESGVGERARDRELERGRRERRGQREQEQKERKKEGR